MLRSESASYSSLNIHRTDIIIFNYTPFLVSDMQPHYFHGTVDERPRSGRAHHLNTLIQINCMEERKPFENDKITDEPSQRVVAPSR